MENVRVLQAGLGDHNLPRHPISWSCLCTPAPSGRRHDGYRDVMMRCAGVDMHRVQVRFVNNGGRRRKGSRHTFGTRDLVVVLDVGKQVADHQAKQSATHKDRDDH